MDKLRNFIAIPRPTAPDSTRDGQSMRVMEAKYPAGAMMAFRCPPEGSCPSVRYFEADPRDKPDLVASYYNGFYSVSGSYGSVPRHHWIRVGFFNDPYMR